MMSDDGRTKICKEVSSKHAVEKWIVIAGFLLEFLGF